MWTDCYKFASKAVCDGINMMNQITLDVTFFFFYIYIKIHYNNNRGAQNYLQIFKLINWINFISCKYLFFSPSITMALETSFNHKINHGLISKKKFLKQACLSLQHKYFYLFISLYVWAFQYCVGQRGGAFESKMLKTTDIKTLNYFGQ